MLADPEKHWRDGFSAAELAHAWLSAGGFPARVRDVLKGCPALAGAEFIDGFFERQVDLRTPGRPSQTDLMVLARRPDGLIVIAVEGKVAESFGPKVRDWNDGSPGKARRLEHLCGCLGIDPAQSADLRYQLFHRCASALFEAERYHARSALMLVHSFSATQASFGDFGTFARALGVELAGPVSSAVHRGGVDLRLAWVADQPRLRPPVSGGAAD